ncbi:hypothetical protein [Serpentinimonas maccroryi]|uniref:hypothetical protein n=1 Tax=Serpentinimonas maccroryi TaxID=1458426 RepID=UPI00203323AB|nr:hypothetical protein [Serpentinimonas maccroryi]MCM2480251.1 hypothetical protein [Serpentinimonas maccroryi]
MRREELKNTILALIEKEMQFGVNYLTKEQLMDLLIKLRANDLSHDDRKNIADYVLANYLGQDDCIAEELIDWILKL